MRSAVKILMRGLAVGWVLALGQAMAVAQQASAATLAMQGRGARG